MPRRDHTPEQILNKLRQVEIAVASGKQVEQAVREIFYSLKEVQVLVEKWRREYNTIRPHSSIGYRPPAPEAVMPQLEMAWKAS